MEPHVKTTPKDFFLYAFAAGALYFCATMLVTLVWQLINHWLPEAAFDTYALESISGVLRLAIAMLVIIFPAYIAAMWWIGRDIDKDVSKREMWVHRWFIWGTLFIAAVTLLGDLVFLVYTLLGGDVAMRFVLKAVTVAAVALAVFVYHWYLLRRVPGSGLAKRKGIAAAATIVVGAAVVAALTVTGSPANARAIANDQVRVSDLQSLQYQVTNFWQLKRRLPKTSNELIDPANPTPLPLDPTTNTSYRYEVRSATEFVLCATFETKMNPTPGNQYPGQSTQPYVGDVSLSSASWAHDQGNVCFTRTIDPERYPQTTPVTK